MQTIRLFILTHQANFKLHVYYIPGIALGWGQTINDSYLTRQTLTMLKKEQKSKHVSDIKSDKYYGKCGGIGGFTGSKGSSLWARKADGKVFPEEMT